MIELPNKLIVDVINIASLLILVMLKITHTENFRSFIKLFWNDDFIHQELKEAKPLIIFKSLFLVLSSVHFSLFITSMLLSSELIDKTSYWIIFSLSATLFFGFIIVKSFAIKILGYTFGIQSHSTYLVSYKINKSIYWFFILFIGQLLLHYSPLEAKQTGLLIVILGLIFLLLSAIKFQLRFKNEIIRHWYYFILYLCTLEIAPYIILYKVILERLN